MSQVFVGGGSSVLQQSQLDRCLDGKLRNTRHSILPLHHYHMVWCPARRALSSYRPHSPTFRLAHVPHCLGVSLRKGGGGQGGGQSVRELGREGEREREKGGRRSTTGMYVVQGAIPLIRYTFCTRQSAVGWGVVCCSRQCGGCRSEGLGLRV